MPITAGAHAVTRVLPLSRVPRPTLALPFFPPSSLDVCDVMLHYRWANCVCAIAFFLFICPHWLVCCVFASILGIHGGRVWDDERTICTPTGKVPWEADWWGVQVAA